MKNFSRSDIRAFGELGIPFGDPFGASKNNDPVSATIAAVSTLAGSYMSSNAAQDAANTQAQAANQASGNQMQMFNTINDQNAPWRQTGANALGSLANYMGLPQTPGTNSNAVSVPTPFDGQIAQLQGMIAAGTKPAMNSPGPALPIELLPSVKQQIADLQTQQKQYITANSPAPAPGSPGTSGDPNFGAFTHQFNAADLKTNLSPNYDFMLQQGEGQAQNAANATGGLLNGNTLQGLNTFAQNYASNAYQNAFSNYNAGQTNIFNRLSDLAGLGQTSNQTTAQAGTSATQSSSNFLTSGAAAQAAGTVGSANAISGGLSNASTMYSLANMLKQPAPASPIGNSGYAVDAAGMLSDRSAKENIRKIGETVHGLGWYEFNYLGDDHIYRGVMADEVKSVVPQAVIHRGSYDYVNYEMLGIRMESA